ncbi:MAG: tetratricopeptide repeat protein [Planctomycetota bacterium]
MRKGILLALAGLVALAAVAGAWRLARSPRVPAPPGLDDPGKVDPMVAQLITRTLAEARAAPKSAERRGRLAMVYHANGLVDLAEPCYEQAIAYDDANVRWWYALALVRAELGDTDAAIATMDQAIARESTHAPAHWRRGEWLLQQGRTEEAESAFRQATIANPNDAAGWTGLARSLIDQGAYAEAARLLQANVLAKRPDFAYARRLLAAAYQQLGHTEEARLELARSRGSRPLRYDPWEDEIESFATGFGPIIGRAGRFIDSGQPRQALSLLAQLRPAHRTHPDLLNKFAEAYFALGEPSRALEDLRIAAREHPDHFPTRINLSVAYERLNQPQLALKYADEAIELNAVSGPAYMQKAQLLANAGNYEAAVEPLELAVRYGVLEPDILALLGFVQARLSRWRDAAETFDQVVQIQPTNDEALAMLAWSRTELGEFDAAWAALQEAAKINAQNPKVRQVAARLRLLQQPAPTQR